MTKKQKFCIKKFWIRANILGA